MRFVIDEIRYSERDVVLRLPFRFGNATVESCPQVYVRARIRFADGSTAEGCSAEMMIPKWFDKNPALTNDDNFAQLRRALTIARDAYTSDRELRTAWQHFAQHYRPILRAGRAAGLDALVASYGPALVDRAVLDALCLHLNCSASAALTANAPGVAPRAMGLADDLDAFSMDAFMSAQTHRGLTGRRIAARHTVGLADALEVRAVDAPQDGLPATLVEVIERYGHRYFKLKLSGDAAADVARLGDIARVIDKQAELITLDGNEQYAHVEQIEEFLDRLDATPALARFRRKIAFIEQPLPRAIALETDVSALAARMPMLIDESDATIDAFVRGRASGYTGVSSKSCKGIYKSILNAARCEAWSEASGEAFFQSGEDLTMQAGVGVQQDLALVGWLGLTHVERNGHHYVNGMSALPVEEQARFGEGHAALYEHSAGATRLHIAHGDIDLGSLECRGFATGIEGAYISWDAMRSTY